MTPGYKTTEFYLTLVVNLIGCAVTVGLVPDSGTASKIAALILMLGTVYGYTQSRAVVKANQK